jgi:hypothetical protein
MSRISRRLLTGCALAVALPAAAAWGDGQDRTAKARDLAEPVVLSGPDIGFRMHGQKGDTVVGELVVRVDGEWKPVQFSFGMKTTR